MPISDYRPQRQFILTYDKHQELQFVRPHQLHVYTSITTTYHNFHGYDLSISVNQRNLNLNHHYKNYKEIGLFLGKGQKPFMKEKKHTQEAYKEAQEDQKEGET